MWYLFRTLSVLVFYQYPSSIRGLFDQFYSRTAENILYFTQSVTKTENVPANPFKVIVSKHIMFILRFRDRGGTFRELSRRSCSLEPAAGAATWGITRQSRFVSPFKNKQTLCPRSHNSIISRDKCTLYKQSSSHIYNIQQAVIASHTIHTVKKDLQI